MSRARSSLGGRSESAEDRLGVRRQSHVRHVEKLAEEGDGDADTGNGKRLSREAADLC